MQPESRVRCPTHGLAVGPEGTCVLCNRRQRRALTIEVSTILAALLGLTALVAAVIAVVRYQVVAPSPVKPQPTMAPDASPPQEAEEPSEAPTNYPIAPWEAPTDEEPPIGPIATAPTSRTNQGTVAGSKIGATQAEAIDRLEKERKTRDAERRVAIEVYTAPWCPACRQAVAWLQANQISFAEHNVDDSESASRRLKSLNPKGSIPTFDIEGQVLTGFSSERVRRAIRKAAEKKVEYE